MVGTRVVAVVQSQENLEISAFYNVDCVSSKHYTETGCFWARLALGGSNCASPLTVSSMNRASGTPASTNYFASRNSQLFLWKINDLRKKKNVIHFIAHWQAHAAFSKLIYSSVLGRAVYISIWNNSFFILSWSNHSLKPELIVTSCINFQVLSFSTYSSCGILALFSFGSALSLVYPNFTCCYSPATEIQKTHCLVGFKCLSKAIRSLLQSVFPKE